MPSLLSKVSGAVATSARSVSRATRRLLRGRRSSRDKKDLPSVGVVDDADALWRREILMGRRCEPLNFSGAIHYDSHGRPIPQPRRGVKAAVTSICRSSDVVDEAVVACSRK